MSAVISRRGTLLLSSASAALASSPSAGAPKPDAELIALCGEIDRLQDHIEAFHFETLQEEEEAEPIIGPLRKRLYALHDDLYQMDATTLAGIQARARTIVRWEPALIGTPNDYQDQMISALLHDLIGEWRP